MVQGPINRPKDGIAPLFSESSRPTVASHLHNELGVPPGPKHTASASENVCSPSAMSSRFDGKKSQQAEPSPRLLSEKPEAKAYMTPGPAVEVVSILISNLRLGGAGREVAEALSSWPRSRCVPGCCQGPPHTLAAEAIQAGIEPNVPGRWLLEEGAVTKRPSRRSARRRRH